MDLEAVKSCPICTEAYDREHNPPLTLNPCGHPICKPCWNQWKTSHRRVATCPHCRTSVQSETVNRALLDMIECSGASESRSVTENQAAKLYPDLHSDGIMKRLYQKGQKRRHFEILRDRCEAGFYVLDNSGSMGNMDGKMFEMIDGKVGKRCYLSRWDELKYKTTHIAEYNIKRGLKAAYYLLNPSSKGAWLEDVDFVVIDPHDVSCSTKFALLSSRILQNQNIRGSTPLHVVTQYFVRHLKDLISTMEYQLYPICYNLITDGEPDNKASFEIALRNLVAKFHVFLCVNMCTDNDAIVEYYNGLDQTLGSELSGMDVIDDFEAEQKEIYQTGNDFFVYTLDLHTCRMAGCYSVMSDLLDEKKLPLHYLASLCKELIVSGGNMEVTNQHVPHYSNRVEFVEYIKKNNRNVYDYSTRSMKPLIDVSSVDWKLGSTSPQTWILEVIKRPKLFLKILFFVLFVYLFVFGGSSSSTGAPRTGRQYTTFSSDGSSSYSSYPSQGQGHGQGQG
eukprot:m.121089 g.121089  ORF g.121089 m.121089 type:complete len:507 (+) comp28844_c0_seq16:276-1796(+)